MIHSWYLFELFTPDSGLDPTWQTSAYPGRNIFSGVLAIDSCNCCTFPCSISGNLLFLFIDAFLFLSNYECFSLLLILHYHLILKSINFGFHILVFLLEYVQFHVCHEFEYKTIPVKGAKIFKVESHGSFTCINTQPHCWDVPRSTLVLCHTCCLEGTLSSDFIIISAIGTMSLWLVLFCFKVLKLITAV